SLAFTRYLVLLFCLFVTFSSLLLENSILARSFTNCRERILTRLSAMSFNALVTKQREYFLSGATHSLKARMENLNKLRKLIEDNSDELCQAVYKDLRRAPRDTVNLEIGNAIVEIDYMLGNLASWMAPERVQKTHLTALDTPLIHKDPKGVVLIISPWNYPIAMILLPLIPALAAGNTVILKPSEISAHTAKAFEDIIPKYFDEEYLAVVNGGIPESTALLKERFDHILYTGCPPVAKVIMEAASKHLTPVTLELGGKCPVVVEDDADINISAKRICWGKWLNNGQTCLAPDYIMVSAKTKPALLEAMRKVLVDFYTDEPKSSKDYSRIISERHFDRLVSLLDKTEGKHAVELGEPDREDLFIPPTVLDVTREDELMKDEIFGPILPVVTVSGINDAIEYIKQGEKPLAAYIFTRSEDKVKKFLAETSSGAVTVNDVIMHLTVDTLPFGGVGNSGMGRYRGKYGFDTFTHEKAVLKRPFFGESLMAIRYPPNSDSKSAQMAKLTGRRMAIPAWLGKGLGFVPGVLLSIVLGMLIQMFVVERLMRAIF
ncbi:hypothetical protein PENTCL1PPCAC_1373, partial [Pristionchus entomophagus]